MFARKPTSKNGKHIPQEWPESLARLLNDTYKKECSAAGKYFDIHGLIYPEEFLVTVSYLSEKDESLAPISLFLSCDMDEMNSEEKVKETQKNYIDLVGLFFDEIFSDEEWSDFEPNWQEVTHKSKNYFYKITRENIALTIEANKLLGPEFDEE
jgi:hypothetical protein